MSLPGYRSLLFWSASQSSSDSPGASSLAAALDAGIASGVRVPSAAAAGLGGVPHRFATHGAGLAEDGRGVVFLVATARSADAVPPALRRCFTHEVSCPGPSAAERRALLESALGGGSGGGVRKGRSCQSSSSSSSLLRRSDLAWAATQTAGLSPADLAALAAGAASAAAVRAVAERERREQKKNKEKKGNKGAAKESVDADAWRAGNFCWSSPTSWP